MSRTTLLVFVAVLAGMGTGCASSRPMPTWVVPNAGPGATPLESQELTRSAGDAEALGSTQQVSLSLILVEVRARGASLKNAVPRRLDGATLSKLIATPDAEVVESHLLHLLTDEPAEAFVGENVPFATLTLSTDEDGNLLHSLEAHPDSPRKVGCTFRAVADSDGHVNVEIDVNALAPDDTPQNGYANNSKVWIPKPYTNARATARFRWKDGPVVLHIPGQRKVIRRGLFGDEVVTEPRVFLAYLQPLG